MNQIQPIQLYLFIMNRLEDFIIKKIKEEGPITFETFMDMALYYPELGYYSSGKNLIGRKGDFYTAPHLHPIFGAMLAKQLMEMWTVMDRPSDFYAVEIGAGAGYLSKDVYDYLMKETEDMALSHYRSDFMKSLKYIIMEPFSHFENRQKNLLEPVHFDLQRSGLNGVTWVKSVRELNDIRGCIFSNELLDAFPVHLVEMHEELKEIYADVEGAELVERRGALSSNEVSDYMNQFSGNMDEGYRTEVNLRLRTWLKEITSVLSSGFLLTIDYGYSAREYYSEERTKGTLLCYHKHQSNENPFSHIGEQDITAHVNFSSLKKWGEELGFQTIGYCPQGTFLVSSGIDEIITELYADSPDYTSQLANIKGLIFPQGMGTSHHVMVQYKGKGSPELQGFSLRNKIGNL